MKKRILKTILVLLLTLSTLLDNVQPINAVENNQNTSQPENTDTYAENVQPVKPVITLKRNKKKVIVTIKNWQKNTEYQIYVKKRGKYKRIKTIRKNKYSFKFDRSKVCRVKVRVAKNIDGKTIFSDYSRKTIESGLNCVKKGVAAQKILHKYLKNNRQYMGSRGTRKYYLFEHRDYCWINVKDNDETHVGNAYRLVYLKKVTNHNSNVCQRYNVKFVMWGDAASYGLYGKIYIMKDGKIVFKFKSGALVGKKLRIRKRYKIVLKELEESDKTVIGF